LLAFPSQNPSPVGQNLDRKSPAHGKRSR
jgi:hypothetical protein